jgi:hypothetical protein
MKICAIRLREVGLFREPVALEGLSGGLDVLAGPNEMGKSTLMRALEAVLFVPFSSQKAETVGRLKPLGGGQPLIEVDFETGGTLWRLRKHFLAGTSASHAHLLDVRSGRIAARGADVQERVLALIGAAPGSAQADRRHMSLLWVRQTEALEALEPSASATDALQSVIDGEIAAVASGPALHVHDLVRRRLEAFQTAKTKAKRGAFLEASKDVQRLTSEVATSRAAFGAAEERLARLERLRLERIELMDPDAAISRSKSVQAARAAVEEARQAREELRLAREAAQARESAARQSEVEHGALAALLADVTALGATMSTACAALGAARLAVTEAEAAEQAALASREEARARLADVHRLLQTREYADAADRLARAEAQIADGRALAARLDELPVTAALVRQMENAAYAIEKIEARRAASAARVEITYEPGARERIRVAGQPVADGRVLSALTPLVLVIPGLGRVTVRSAGSEDAEEDAADLAAHRAVLAETLAQARTETLAEARAALQQRSEIEATLTAARGTLNALVPEGIEALRVRARQLAMAVGQSIAGADPARADRSVLETRRAEGEAALEAAERALDAAAAARAACELRAAEIASQLTAAEARHADLTARLPAAATATLVDLARRMSEAHAARDEALRTRSAWERQVPDDAVWQERQRALEGAMAAEVQHARSVSQLEAEIARLEGEMAADRAAEVGQQLEATEGALAAAERRLHAIELEVSALQLLDRLLGEAEASSRAQFLVPVMERIAPYLRTVLPEAEIGLGAGFRVESLTRAGETHALDRLSTGTQEQIAVLVRLGFGRLFAEQGSPAPVILDDALVYADDARIERLFCALRAASELHQVIVLTCRARAFEALGGRRLALTPWRVD